jgi:cytochrome b involved in lipid metabolism
MESRHRAFLRQEIPVKRNVAVIDQQELVSMMDKQEVVLFENLVVDISDFKSAHPGGKHLLAF